jgi:predicted nucleotidyltransferase
MKRDEILRLLRGHQDELAHTFGVRRLALFGSAARDEATDRSDVDIVVAFNGPTTFDAYMGLKLRLEDVLGCPVDLVTETGLKPRAKILVERDAILVA